jgi:hypothetical protein
VRRKDLDDHIIFGNSKHCEVLNKSRDRVNASMPSTGGLTASFCSQSVDRVVTLSHCPHLPAERKRCRRRHRFTIRINIDDADLDRGVILRRDQAVCAQSQYLQHVSSQPIHKLTSGSAFARDVEIDKNALQCCK